MIDVMASRNVGNPGCSHFGTKIRIIKPTLNLLQRRIQNPVKTSKMERFAKAFNVVRCLRGFLIRLYTSFYKRNLVNLYSQFENARIRQKNLVCEILKLNSNINKCMKMTTCA